MDDESTICILKIPSVSAAMFPHGRDAPDMADADVLVVADPYVDGIALCLELKVVRKTHEVHAYLDPKETGDLIFKLHRALKAKLSAPDVLLAVGEVDGT